MELKEVKSLLKNLKKKFKIPKYKISTKENKWFIEFDCSPDKFELTLSGKDIIIYYWSVSNSEVEEIGATPELEFLEKELRKIFGEVNSENSEELTPSKPR